MTAANPQRGQFTLFHKFSTEVRPSEMVQRDDRLRALACPFEEIAESEEEDIQLPERTSHDGRSPFAVTFDSSFAERRRTSPRSLSPAFTRKLFVPLCRGFSDPCLRRPQTTTMSGSLIPDRHDAGYDLLTLPSIPETAHRDLIKILLRRNASVIRTLQFRQMYPGL